MLRILYLGYSLCSASLLTVSAADLAFSPNDITELFPPANAQSVVRFHAPKNSAPGTSYSYQVKAYEDRVIEESKVVVDEKGMLPIKVTLPVGYYEIVFSAPNIQSTGLWVRPESEPVADPFFSMDSALSWLTKIERRPALIKNLRWITGTEGLSRERLSWTAINPKEGQWDWETAQGYETTLKKYAQEKTKVLEVFHDAPPFLGKAQNGRFPSDLVGAANGWREVALRWHSLWSALEVWNEPDIRPGGNQPADQYVPIVKTVRYAMQNAGAETPLGGGVFATMNPSYLDLAARNGLLDECDFISFHYYGDALGLERLIGQYRTWLKKYDFEGKPLWLTEVGQWWSGKPGARPSVPSQTTTALTYAMQMVEARACGVVRCFPFVYVDYNNSGGRRYFGLLDPAGTPLRSLVALAQISHVLSGTTYLGDIPAKVIPKAKRIRVFSRTQSPGLEVKAEELLVVIYTGMVSPKAEVALPFAVKSAQGIDGRPIHLKASGTVPIPDGIVYLSVTRAALKNLIVKDTEAMRLYQIAQSIPKPPAPVSPIVLQPELDLQRVQAMSSRGYFLTADKTRLPVKVWINNLSDEERVIQIRVGGEAESGITVPAKSRKPVTAEVDVMTLQSGMGDAKRLPITATSSGGERIAPAELSVTPSDGVKGIAEYLQESRYQFVLSVGEEYRWDKNSSGKLAVSYNPPAAWGFTVKFPPGVDRWAYPRFTVPQEVESARVTGVLVRARCMQPATVRLQTWNDAGVMSFTPFPIFSADGDWHLVYIPFSSYLADGKIAKLSIGLNSNTDTNSLEISDLYLIGK